MTGTVSLCLLWSLFFMAGAVISCNKGPDSMEQDAAPSRRSMDEIERQLLSQDSLQQEAPFVERAFDPFLDGRWIGNAVSYGCYRKDQEPGRNGPSQAEILEDLAIITQYWNLIRVYGGGDDTRRILQVIREHNLPVRVLVGIWLEREEANPGRRDENIQQVLSGIALADEYQEIIAALNVGNETQVFWSWHRMRQDNLLRYIRAVRSNTSVPVTTADDYNFWNKPESKLVAQEVDFIISHIYPLWNGKTLEDAVDWMDGIYADIQRFHPDKEIVIGETGWATDFNPEKKGPDEQGTLIKGEVSVRAQGEFLIDLNRWVNKNRVTTFLFEAFDEPWKGGGEATSPREVEKHWGVFYENRTGKESFLQYQEQIGSDPG